MRWIRLVLISLLVAGFVFVASMAFMPQTTGPVTLAEAPRDNGVLNGQGGGGFGTVEFGRPEVSGSLEFEYDSPGGPMDFGALGGLGPDSGLGGLGPDSALGGLGPDSLGGNAADFSGGHGKLLPVFNAPMPVPVEQQFIVIHTMGETRGFHAAAAYLAAQSNQTFADFLKLQSVGEDLLPTHMPASGHSSDWARVGVVSGIFRCLHSASTTPSMAGQIPNFAEKNMAMEQVVLKSCVSHSNDFTDPIIRAQLLNSLDARWKRIRAEGKSSGEADKLQEQIPLKIGVAAEQADSAHWWQSVWSSSLLATFGGLLTTVFVLWIEKRMQEKSQPEAVEIEEVKQKPALPA